MVTMERIDALMKEAAEGQAQALEQLQMAEDIPITGVQVNDASRIVTIYQRETGEPRQLPRLAAEFALRKRYRDPTSPLFRQFIFSATPTKTYHWGLNKCLLHPDNPQRAEYDKWGLPVCESAKLASPGEVRRHMELRHPSADKIIKAEQQELQRQQELAAQHALASSVLEALRGMGQNTSVQSQVAEEVAEEEGQEIKAPARRKTRSKRKTRGAKATAN